MAKGKKAEVKANGYSGKALMLTLLIVAGAMFALVAYDMVMPFRRGAGFDFFMLNAYLSIFIIVCSVWLTYIYLKDYMELKSPFTVALLFVTVSFMLFGMSSNPFFHMFFGLGRMMIGPSSAVPLFFAAIAMGVLVWISNK
jgi:hypothetical protein